jgi:cytidyltransferase-like protein
MQQNALVWVYADVVCDLFHPGHVEFFRQARALGDRLVVGLVSDVDVMSYKRAPVMTYAERVAVVQGCRHVDKVLDAPAPLYCTRDFLDRIGANFACHGDDFPPAEISRWYADLIPSGRVKVVPYTKNISTSTIIERIIKRVREDDQP